MTLASSFKKNYMLVISALILLVTETAHAQKLFRYSCQADRVSIEEFESSRTFDKKGIILSDKEYHPLSIARFGLLAYYKFEDTRDSAYFYKCVTQADYFKDDRKVHSLFQGKGIGLPYNFKFWDLEAPWYSGMTQGFAISYLLRYYQLTHDETILPVIKKIAFVLLAPQEEGGSISTTEEGCTWIEEYPNSKKSKHVLNGFINGLIGLYEYCAFFPEDSVAKQVFEEAYECMLKSLELYDTSKWSYYDRSRRSLADNYMWYQIYEMKHLYEMFQEPIFDYQMRIWSVMLSGRMANRKADQIKFVNRYNSEKAEKMNDSLFSVSMKPAQNRMPDSLEVLQLKSKKDIRRFCKGKDIRTKERSKLSYILFLSSVSDSADYVKMTFNDSEIKEYKVTLHRRAARGISENDTIGVTKFFNNNELYLVFPKMSISEIALKVENRKPFSLAVLQTDFFDTSRSKKPFFAHSTFPGMRLKEGEKYMVSLPVFNTEKTVIFYKSAHTEKALANAKWKAINTIKPNSEFISPEYGFYSFMVVYDWKNPLSMVGKLQISEQK
ncbi:D-glucuronyl C5-epimerase C-terminus [Mariniphaga anaerophila]|uniref:D-glucuronyl C5-epimerase C-terminus n=1 Tax=Mariniphaga anaerophila TaxID=1484053 RepID=A0A1M5BRB9_9BACT|nr:D-glucuronyl C5-epimerase family protein [Mariniphaga anaerophila]SHF45079.1 D-glucuronyl C5-epimerase C-terminus [Mariniphaga anaerophila]